MRTHKTVHFFLCYSNVFVIALNILNALSRRFLMKQILGFAEPVTFPTAC